MNVLKRITEDSIIIGQTVVELQEAARNNNIEALNTALGQLEQFRNTGQITGRKLSQCINSALSLALNPADHKEVVQTLLGYSNRIGLEGVPSEGIIKRMVLQTSNTQLKSNIFPSALCLVSTSLERKVA